MQTRHVLPGWFGVGTSVASFIAADRDAGASSPRIDRKKLALLNEMYGSWAPFRALIDNIQMTIAKADFDIARSYAELVNPRVLGDRIYRGLRDEFELSRRMVLLVTRQRNILDNNETLQRSIELRNPYVDPMSFIQVELLRRLGSAQLSPSERHDLEEAVFLSINGIAAGLRNTG
jgi:phosphoenolpyruvate carboxylase